MGPKDAHDARSTTISTLCDSVLQLRCLVSVGQWEKHNNIFGMILSDNATAQAFSHFSFEHSDGRYICLDVQVQECLLCPHWLRFAEILLTPKARESLGPQVQGPSNPHQGLGGAEQPFGPFEKKTPL